MKWIFLFSALISFAPQASYAEKKPLWIYASIYKEHLSMLKNAFEKKYPDVDVQFFQGGSEKIQSKIEAELMASKVEADLVLTSDPFWADDMKKRGLSNQQVPNPGATNYYSLV